MSSPGHPAATAAVAHNTRWSAQPTPAARLLWDMPAHRVPALRAVRAQRPIRRAVPERHVGTQGNFASRLPAWPVEPRPHHPRQAVPLDPPIRGVGGHDEKPAPVLVGGVTLDPVAALVLYLDPQVVSLVRFDPDDELPAALLGVAMHNGVRGHLGADEHRVISHRAARQNLSQERPRVADLLGKSGECPAVLPDRLGRRYGQRQYSVSAHRHRATPDPSQSRQSALVTASGTPSINTTAVSLRERT